MHIGFLTPEYPHPELSRAGGLGTSIKNLAMGLVKNEVNVSVFVIGQSRNVNYDDSGIKVISLAKRNTLLLIGTLNVNEFRKSSINTLKQKGFN